MQQPTPIYSFTHTVLTATALPCHLTAFDAFSHAVFMLPQPMPTGIVVAFITVRAMGGN